jgi:hypothetical protein
MIFSMKLYVNFKYFIHVIDVPINGHHPLGRNHANNVCDVGRLDLSTKAPQGNPRGN